MATVSFLKQALKQKASEVGSTLKQPLPETQYSACFDIFLEGPGWTAYQDFIIPQLSQLLVTLSNSGARISVLEVGPGPKSILEYLPKHLRHKVRRYTAFEPNGLFATRLENWLCSPSETESPLPRLETSPDIRRIPFVLQNSSKSETCTSADVDNEKYDIVLFCHSMYGMNPKPMFIEQALAMLTKQPQDGMVVVFHRDGALHLDDLVCQQMASFPTGVIRVSNNDETLDSFAAFTAGFNVQNTDVGKAIQVSWREICRALGRQEKTYPHHLLFSSPNVMAVFTQHATTLLELTAAVPLIEVENTVKNREARLQRPASIVRPSDVCQVQQCVRWARKHRVSLTVVGGGHSGHCLRPAVVAVDMSAFDQISILTSKEKEQESGLSSGSLIVAEAGCKTGDIIRKAMAAGLTVPLGSRPSVGAGLWLQGGIGHLARLHGLACDAIVGAVVVSADSGQVLCIGRVPSQHQPTVADRPENETDLLWALKGAGTNFGIVLSVTFEAYAAPTYVARHWTFPLSNSLAARCKLSEFDKLVAGNPRRNCSADAYLYWKDDRLHLGVAMFESSTTSLDSATPTPVHAIWGPEQDTKVVDGVGLFDTEMYMSGMHSGHGGGKTSSFKRCLFLKRIAETDVADRLVAAVASRPTPSCYLHLLQGGGAVGDITADAAAFGCRDWDFACVITGVWPRNDDDTDTARSAVRWVYSVAERLLPFSSGAYGADLGPDPRDAVLAAKAFGPNRPRLARLKGTMDPGNVLAYACPLPKVPTKQKLIILVTGESGAGKDFCAEVWASVFLKSTYKSLAVSISDGTKREYAAATGADLSRLLSDRAYKEEHRPALTAFFEEQLCQRPGLPEEHFLNVVCDGVGVDVLLITGMREAAPVATLSHLVPDSRLLEVYIQASPQTRRIRRGCRGDDDHSENENDSNGSNSNLMSLTHCPDFIFDNNTAGKEAIERFSERHLLPFLHQDLKRLDDMVRLVPDFPRASVEFRHVLGISQQPGGLALCTSLLKRHFADEWAKVDVIACCEAGGFIYASALALQVGLPLALIRKAGKLPPPTISVPKPASYISSLVSGCSNTKQFEMERGVIARGGSVLVVDDVLSTGKTLCAVLQLLNEAGVAANNIRIMVVAEFPLHSGRELLRQRGFSKTNIQSLLVFGSA